MKKSKREYSIKIDQQKHQKLYKAFKWLDNIWYHYKAAILITAFFSFVIIFGFAQCMTKTEPDYKVLLCVNKYVSPQVRSAMEIYLEQYAEDVNGDGKVDVYVVDCSAGTDLDSYNANMTTLLAELQRGEAVLLICDDTYYDKLTVNGEIFDTDSRFDAKDGKALTLSGTDFGNFVNMAYSDFITDDVRLYKRIMDGTDSGESKTAEDAKVNNEAMLEKFVIKNG